MQLLHRSTTGPQRLLGMEPLFVLLALGVFGFFLVFLRKFIGSFNLIGGFVAAGGILIYGWIQAGCNPHLLTVFLRTLSHPSTRNFPVSKGPSLMRRSRKRNCYVG